MEIFISSMWPQRDPNPNRNSNPTVRAEVNSRENDKRSKSQNELWKTKNQMHTKNIVADVKGKMFESCVDKKIFILDVTLS